ncbi:MAG TPA: DUF3566 domain-containing protein [Mycobacterium sp.]|nr:DUF3566 domain-containing protein [Mycobacterium sp.]
MTSPYQPENTGSVSGPTEPGTAGRPAPEPARSTTAREVVPPWQRGTVRQRPAAPLVSEAAGHAPEADTPTSRMLAGTAANRVVTGTAAPTSAGHPPATGKHGVRPAEETRVDKIPPVPDARDSADLYASELPDLSGSARPAPPAATAKPAGTVRPATTGAVGVSRRSGPLRASVQLRRIDPWTTLKASLILSVALFFVWMIAVAFLYLMLGAMGVWSKLNSNVGDLLHQTNVGGGGDIISASTIFGGATLIGLVNIVLLTAMAAIGAFVYNLTADLVGGVEVTLADRD